MANENETVEQIAVEMMACHMQVAFCEDIRTYGYAVQEANNRQIAAQKREMAAKDAEIARLKRENIDINGCLLAEQELAEKRDALIKEFVELLNKLIPDECYRVCGKDPCDHIAILEDIKTNGGEPCPCVLLSALIAKAKEVVSKMETTTEVCK